LLWVTATSDIDTGDPEELRWRINLRESLTTEQAVGFIVAERSRATTSGR
jgi:hypothetical protein